MKKKQHFLNGSYWYVPLVVISLCLFGCGLREVSDICHETPSETYLVKVRSVDYSAIGSMILNDPVNHLIEICNVHFAANTPAGHELILACNEISDVKACKLNFTLKWAGIGHKTPFDLFPENPTGSIFDYVDVSADMPEICALPDDLTFAMRTCKFDKSGGNTDHFTIMAKSTNYSHFTDPTSDDHPYKHGILHELAHAFGMKHTGSWNSDDQQYISTMQGNLEYLSALDVAYLRENYPESTNDHRNYVASSLTRFSGTKGIFNKQNPDEYYVTTDGYLKDCATNDDPEFYVAWFNTGNIGGESEICGVNCIFLREKSVDANIIKIKTWRIATMPYLSQDQWQGQVSIKIDNPDSIDFSKSWELVFLVNGWETLEESTMKDNEITMDVELKDGSC